MKTRNILLGFVAPHDGWHCFALLICLAMGLAACKKGEKELCQYDDECKEGLSCYQHTVRDEANCLTRESADANCRDSLFCSTSGKCSAALKNTHEICIATSQEDCAKALECKGITCKLSGNRCVATIK